MKNFFFTSFLILFTTLSAYTQEFQIKSSSAAITVGGHLKSAKDVINKFFPLNTVIRASEKDVLIKFSYNDEDGYLSLPFGRQIKISDIKNSQYTTLDPSDSYFAFIFDLIKYFRKKGEKVKDYQERMAEVLGQIRGNKLSLLESPINKRELKSYDIEPLNRLNDSLTTLKITDSTVFYLKDAIFLDQNNYFGLALDKYKKAYNYQKNNGKSSIVVWMVYQQALFRAGKTEEGEALNQQ